MNHDLEWQDGNFPFSQEYGDHFFSKNNGRDECRHVFIGGNRLESRWQNCKKFTIGELGFGTGLNFLETWRLWRETRIAGQCLSFVSFEKSPLEPEIIEKASTNWPELRPLIPKLIDFWSKREQHPGGFQLDGQTTLEVIIADACKGVENWPGKADAWYLDGFSPAKNPAMWSRKLMQAVHDHTCKGGTFATYTAAGWVRQNLQLVGFHVERVKGHGKKRHMTIGRLDKNTVP